MTSIASMLSPWDQEITESDVIPSIKNLLDISKSYKQVVLLPQGIGNNHQPSQLLGVDIVYTLTAQVCSITLDITYHNLNAMT